MGKNRGIAWALLISLIGHCLFWWWAPPLQQERPVLRFDVVLEPAREMSPAGETVLQEPPEIPAEPDLAPAPPVDAAGLADIPADEVISIPPAEAPVKLNLSRPPQWDEIVSDLPAPKRTLAFNPALGRAVQAREAELRRQGLVRQRLAAVYGVADDAYTRDGALGTELKREGGCVTLVENRDLEEGQRWWASTCTETRQNALTLPTVEYDALGRVAFD